jgi:phosphoribosylglycinamide formyltransferase 1
MPLPEGPAFKVSVCNAAIPANFGVKGRLPSPHWDDLPRSSDEENVARMSKCTLIMSLRIVILLTGRHGRGSNMEAIARACHENRIDGSVVLVAGNVAGSPALERAASLGLPAAAIRTPRKGAADAEPASPPADDTCYGEALLRELGAVDAELICLAGYMRKLPPAVTAAYRGRIMNIHAALLPSFGGQGMYGMNVHQAVIDYGAKVSGCTVHFVDADYDTGPIILQTTVPVEDGDTPETLAARVLVAEHATYPAAVALFAANRLRVEGRRVRIA